MKRQELTDRVGRIEREEKRLKKEIWQRIQKIVSKHFTTCQQFPDIPMMIFTKLKDNSLYSKEEGSSWKNTRDYKVPHHDGDNWDSAYIGFTEDSMCAGFHVAMAMNDPMSYSVKQLHGVLKQVENMKFNNVVDFSL